MECKKSLALRLHKAPKRHTIFTVDLSIGSRIRKRTLRMEEHMRTTCSRTRRLSKRTGFLDYQFLLCDEDPAFMWTSVEPHTDTESLSDAVNALDDYDIDAICKTIDFGKRPVMWRSSQV